MGEDPAATTTTTTPATNTNAASIISSITAGLTSIANTAMTVFGTQGSTTAATVPGGPVINIPAQQRAGMDPTMIALIGIPAMVLLAAMVMKGNRR